ncbi:MAG TPA: hypothetical protein GXX41_13540 [Thermoanaerobacterium sp.]|nr:hypothetical protein [Thermoanaerobacterium sp.]
MSEEKINAYLGLIGPCYRPFRLVVKHRRKLAPARIGNVLGQVMIFNYSLDVQLLVMYI